MVWRATQVGTMREVALKVLAPWRAHVLAPLRFEREAEIAASLEHEAIARVFGAGDCGAGPWIAMELVPGPPADDWVRETNPSMRERVVFFSRVCAGVSHAHQRGVIHRDLKPGNVLVTPDGTPKIVDFGLARRETDDSMEVDFTQEGDFLGTLAWMSPEQARGEWTEVDALSDVFALGAMLFGLLADAPPLDPNLPPAAQLAAAQSGERRRLREVLATAPRDLDAVVARCLQARKSDRYQSVAELVSDLGRWLAGEPVRAPVDSPLYWPRKKLRRHWKAAALLSVGTLSAAGLAGGYLYGKARIEAEKSAALEREAEQRQRTLHEAQELVTQLLVEMRPYFEQAGHPEWIEEAERRLQAFPWDETLRGPYDPRRFRGRTALVQGDMLAAKGQWANALEAYHDAIDQFKTLVPENPGVDLFREELVRARLGETKALIKLGFHKEAYRAARHVLDLTAPRPDQPISVALTAAMIEGVEQFGAACLPMPGRAHDALDVARRAHAQVVAQTSTPAASPEAAEWQARLSLWIARLAVPVEQAAQARSDTSHAEADARHFASLTAHGERSGRLLASALVVVGDLALREKDMTRARQAIEEATGLVGDSKLSAGLSGSVHVEVARAWERLAGVAGVENSTAAIEANDRALRLWDNLVQHASPTDRLVAMSRLCLANTRLAQQANDLDAVAKYGLLTVRKFELGVKKDAVRPAMALDCAEASILLFEAGVPPRPSGSSWLECLDTAWQWLANTRQRISPESQIRRAQLEPRVNPLLGL